MRVYGYEGKNNVVHGMQYRVTEKKGKNDFDGNF